MYGKNIHVDKIVYKLEKREERQRKLTRRWMRNPKVVLPITITVKEKVNKKIKGSSKLIV